MRANDLQIGGRHYKTTFEHWDLVIATGMGYLEGCTTKYAFRWRKKNGIEDLRKALHYLNKLQEAAPLRILPFPFEETVKWVAKFNEANDLSDLERAYIAGLATWQNSHDLDEARQILFFLIDEAEALIVVKPVTLTEENKHAEGQEG